MDKAAKGLKFPPSKIVLKVARVIFGPHLAYISLLAPFFLIAYLCISIYVTPSLLLQPQQTNPCRDASSSNFHVANLTCDSTNLIGESDILTRLYLKDLPYFILATFVILFTVYFGISAWIHHKYYVKQKDTSEVWKTQPKKFLTRDLEFEGTVETCTGILMLSLMTGMLLCYAFNQGPFSKIYFSLNGSNFWWTLLQGPFIFLWQDHTDYWRHRIFHSPWWYKKLHKMHHKYIQTTAYTAFAIHPLEIISIVSVPLVAVFVLPIYIGWLVFNAMFLFVYGLLDHSGVDLKTPRWMPWIPDMVFHDKHHSHFDVNFGLYTWFWDALFETCAQIRSENFHERTQ